MTVDFKPRELIAPTTSAITTPVSFAVQQRFWPATLYASGTLSGVEEVAVFMSADNGVTFTPALKAGSAVVLNLDANEEGIFGPALLGVTKTATAVPVGVYLWTNQLASQTGSV